MSPTVTPFFHSATHSYAYVVADPSSAAAAIVDPVLDFEPASARTATLFADAMLAHLRDRKLELRWVLETHAHADHLSAAGYVCAQTGAALGIGAGIAAVQAHFANLFGLEAQLAHEPDAFDARFGDGERIAFGALELQIVATPGHTPDGVTYVIGDAAFVGDTVFQPDVGTARCDFPGADAATLYRSIERILALPEPMRLFHCHDYPPRGREPRAQSDAAGQRARNIHLAGRDEAAFVELRTARDRTLPVPALLLPAMQWNLRGGRAPAREANGIAYLKLPLDAI
ncbi:MAG TPA: MBL fold metallo-hydrolase [Candidatus Saccharimonadia bacterium]|nr:MBL fold metallo-hydrolase [Candidatus Saccharimonadia bacterium]